MTLLSLKLELILESSKKIYIDIMLNHWCYLGWTALHYAAIEEDSDMVRILLEAGADIEAKDNNG